MEQRFFRAGVGTVIYDDRHQVAFFRRAKYPIGVWQFQQGGIDVGETITTALWRELKEEVGLSEPHFESVIEYPEWLSYADPSALENQGKDRMGQTHRWFFLKLNGGMKLDLGRASDHEFNDHKWITFEQAIIETDNFKKPVYEALYRFFLEHIKPR